jgi:hypothetical protein
MTLENNGPIKTYYPRKTCLSKINKTFFQLQKKNIEKILRPDIQIV